MNERIVVYKGRYPWNSVDATDAVQLLTTENDETNKCLCCTKPECTNCLCTDKTTKDIDRCEELLSAHMSVKQICLALQISRTTFYKYKAACAV